MIKAWMTQINIYIKTSLGHTFIKKLPNLPSYHVQEVVGILVQQVDVSNHWLTDAWDQLLAMY